MSSRRALLESLLLSRLPSAFQEVEYIESSGTQYIDIGYACLTANQKVIIQFETTNSFAGNGIFGSQSSSARSGILWRSSTNLQFGIGNQGAGTVIGTYSQNVKYTFDYSSTQNTYSCRLNDTYLRENASYTGSNITNLNIFLFANNYQGSAESPVAIRMYSAKLYDNGVLARDFVPCYRKADNVIGLYDLVNGVFYTNAGSGTFTKGGDVL